MPDFHLDQHNPATIGFVVKCLFQEAISLEELRAWADHVLVEAEDYPDYMIELGSFQGYLKDIYKAIGFVPSRSMSKSELHALLGIAYSRGREPYDPPISRVAALAALERHPEILQEFRATFPFLGS